MRSGDTLVVWRPDRLGRSLRHLVDVIAALDPPPESPDTRSRGGANTQNEGEQQNRCSPR
ncbi:MAG: recombinase family protein [Solirubrobacteraceae bacterium]